MDKDPAKNNNPSVLKPSAELCHMILDEMSEGVVVADMLGRFVLWNPAAVRMVGAGPADIGPEKWPEYYHLFLDDRTTPFPYEKLPLLRALRGEEVDEVEIWLCRIDSGEYRCISVNARPLHDSGGRQSGAIAVFRDITSHKTAEEIVSEKDAQLAHSQAEVEQLELFAYVAAHDLREPLQKIITLGDLLRRGNPSLDEQSKDYLNRMQKAAQRMSRLMQDLLQFTSVATRPARLDEKVDLNQILKETAQEVDDLMAAKKGKIIQSTLPEIQGNNQLLRLLFKNLIHNSLKFSREGVPPVIKVCAERQGPDWIFTFEDNGIGFDRKDAERVFKPFERLDRSRDYEGSGIGLAICQKIVLRHQGRIRAESRLGQGSVFVIIIPKSAAEAILG